MLILTLKELNSFISQVTTNKSVYIQNVETHKN